MSSLKIIEMFKSIEGEGVDIGIPTFFLRLAGCNINCYYCDTKYSWNYESGKDILFEDIIKEFKKSLTKRFLITGGNPLLQSKNLNNFIESTDIRKMKVDINIESPGMFINSDIYKLYTLVDRICLDFKPKKIYNFDNFGRSLYLENTLNTIKMFENKIVLKVILSDIERDFKFFINTFTKDSIPEDTVIQVVSFKNSDLILKLNKAISFWEKNAKDYNIRFLPQLHKILQLGECNDCKRIV